MVATQVVNLRKEYFDIYIGRPSIFGNPKKVDKLRPLSRDEAIAWYRKYFYKKIKTDPKFKFAVERLRGKILGCYCKPLPCHGDIIVEYLECREL